MNQTQQHTDSIKRSVSVWERTNNALVSTPLSQHSIPTMPASHKFKSSLDIIL